MLGVMRETFDDDEASIKGVEDFFSVARTTPLAALMPSEVTPWLTALRAYSGCVVSGVESEEDALGRSTNLDQLSAVEALAEESPQ